MRGWSMELVDHMVFYRDMLAFMTSIHVHEHILMVFWTVELVILFLVSKIQVEAHFFFGGSL